MVNVLLDDIRAAHETGIVGEETLAVGHALRREHARERTVDVRALFNRKLAPQKQQSVFWSQRDFADDYIWPGCCCQRARHLFITVKKINRLVIVRRVEQHDAIAKITAPNACAQPRSIITQNIFRAPKWFAKIYAVRVIPPKLDMIERDACVKAYESVAKQC